MRLVDGGMEAHKDTIGYNRAIFLVGGLVGLTIRVLNRMEMEGLTNHKFI